MDVKKLLNNYIKEQNKEPSDIVEKAKSALRESGNGNYEVFFAKDKKLVLVDMSGDNLEQGVVIKNGAIVDFNNTDDYSTVTVNAAARYNILKRVSNGEKLQELKDLFRNRRTWVIHYVKDDNYFEAHTHGMDSYGHPDFRIKNDIGPVETAYVLNSLCKSIQRGNAFRSGNRIEDLYDNAHVILKKADDGKFDVFFESSESNAS